MNEWKKLSEETPPLDTPVWAGWFNQDGSFTAGLLVMVDDGISVLWGRCDNSIPYANFGILLDDDPYPVSHWMYLPKPPEK
ncbi:hypothetical protein [Neisseria mucosa]|uniref:hypothetical protein n=1 Tax=Neisseria mucosa TaxID=488 RepID=UPI0027E00B06|nr:hypothetical protein [Neisseria mucosa]